ncbi:MAG: phosphoribosylanthranilate isomerase [Herpetosiphon sp.]
MPLVKICGVRTVEAAMAAAAEGADFVGLIFAPTRRRVTLEGAQAITRALRADPQGADVAVVGVFVNESTEQIEQIAEDVGLDWVQLSGHEEQGSVSGLRVPLIKAIRFDGHPSEQSWLASDDTCGAQPLVVDAHVEGTFGGAGVKADWQTAAALAQRRSVLLAGGLTSENVGAAISCVQPWGVDVSSGVETEGQQDLDKIRAFIRAAKAHQ